MILVDIFVPAVDNTYNFSLNEDIPIEKIIGEITAMIAQKEQTKLTGDMEKLMLYDLNGKRPLPRENTLNDCYITTGTDLMLV
ncbi:MAG: EsaB/YukD family protein [Lachnospiraceae bacterium]|nr:EsaB/YukD family protein [Lachnospiraceae bacterium]